jgi:hypothetical protein
VSVLGLENLAALRYGAGMLTAAQMRKLALSMPEAEEKSHFEQPDFRVRNKIFAGLSPDGALGTLKLRPEVQAMVMEAKPDAFIPAAGAWGRSGWTRVVLANIELGALTDLVREAWELVAPKRLVEAQRSGATGATSRDKTRRGPAAGAPGGTARRVSAAGADKLTSVKRGAADKRGAAATAVKKTKPKKPQRH